MWPRTSGSTSSPTRYASSRCGGQTQGIVGSYQQVAERLDELVQLGADAFILASTPHLEEACRVGEEVLPLVRGHTAALLRAA